MPFLPPKLQPKVRFETQILPAFVTLMSVWNGWDGSRFAPMPITTCGQKLTRNEIAVRGAPMIPQTDFHRFQNGCSFHGLAAGCGFGGFGGFGPRLFDNCATRYSKLVRFLLST